MARTSKTRLAILGMLMAEPMTGYRLREAIAESIGHFWQESFGQLYPTLRELEQQKLVVSDRKSATGGRRIQYAITDAGRQALRAWLESDPESFASNRSELLLQLFFGRHAGPGVIRGRLERHRTGLLAARDEYRAFERLVLDDGAIDQPYWLATVRHGLAMVDASLAWVDQTIADLGPGEQGEER